MVGWVDGMVFLKVVAHNRGSGVVVVVGVGTDGRRTFLFSLS